MNWNTSFGYQLMLVSCVQGTLVKGRMYNIEAIFKEVMFKAFRGEGEVPHPSH